MNHAATRCSIAFAVAALFACGGSPSAPAAPTTPANPPTGGSANCAATSVGLTALTDLVSGSYKGEAGGLYPGRANSHPNSTAGLNIARAIGPRDGATGTPDPNGRYAFVSIGMFE